MLTVTNLVKKFGGIKAVSNCSLEVKKGTITGLIGPNGAGKTTLFNLITGFCNPDDGQILLNGERVDGLLPHEIFHKGVARTFQIAQELQSLTVLENLMLVPKNQIGERIWFPLFRFDSVRKQEKKIRDKALEILEFVELVDLGDQFAKNLSGGQKKLLELARAMMADPRLILLDEPGAGINPTLMKKLSGYIETLREEGITFLLIEHDMNLVMSLCNPVIVMSNGSKLAEGPPQDVKRNPEVLDAYLGAG